MSLPTGKVSPYELVKLVFPYLHLKDERVLVGPGLGLDASVIEFEDRVLVVSSDPITGAIRDPGWLSVHVNANDVATMGATPRWFLANFFLPPRVERSEVKKLTERTSAACKELGVTLVGGHTEVTPNLSRVLISGTMVGEAPRDRWVSAAAARLGDRVLLTKGAAIEGTFILASDREEELSYSLGKDLVDRAKKFREKLSVVKDALTAIEAGGVDVMHDPTEGGLSGGLHELADASGLGFKVEHGAVPVAEETRAICEEMGIDPLRTISSGSLLICARPESSKGVIKALRGAGLEVANIGEMVEDGSVREMDGEELEFPEQDEIWRVFKGR